MQKSEEQKTVEDYLKAGNQLKKEAKLDGAIGQYEQALHLNPDFVPTLSQLAAIYESQKQFGKALSYREQAAGLQPEDAVLRAQLANITLRLGKTQEAITLYQKAITLSEHLPLWVYNGLGNALAENGQLLAKNGQLEEAIQQYQQALHLNPDFVPAISQLAGIYESQKQFGKALSYREQAAGLQPKNAVLKAALANTMVFLGKTQEAITLYQKAIALDEHLPLWVYNGLGNALAKNGRLEEAIASYEKALELQPDSPNLLQQIARLKEAIQERENEGAIYNKIWRALNQTSLENFEQESANFPTEISSAHVSQYFNIANQAKIIDLESLSEEDKLFIESAGLSLEYLKLNRNPVTPEGVSEEKTIERGSFGDVLQLAIEQGCVYACCPSTGRIVKSNRSLVNSRGYLVFYRFVANEVFYLICGDSMTKVCLYFPRLELNIWLAVKTLFNERNKVSILKEIGTDLRILMVSNWLKLKAYLLHTGEVKKAALLVHFPTTPWHQVHNYFSPIYKLYETGYSHQIDRFLLVNYREPESNYGTLDEIFNEIAFERIEFSHLRDEILENNLFVFSIKFDWERQYISDNLANLMYQASLRKCTSDFLAEVKEARTKYFPLVWINFRIHKRVWVSQVEGIANIIKNLAANFPKLGVVFDGFTRIDIGGKLVFNPQEETIIKQEKDIVNRIQGLLPEGIKVYDIIGCPMHEAIVWAYAIDLYFVPVGTGLIKVRLPNKPGAVHSGTILTALEPHKEMRENCVFPVPVPGHQIIKVSPQSTGGSDNKHVVHYDYDSDYDFDWRVAYEELFKMASSLKTVNDYLKAGNQLKKEAKLDGAIGQYEQALHLNPDFVPALSQLAAIYESQKQFGKALPYRERAAGLRPKDAVLGANLARTMKSLGKTQEAIRQYEQALHLNPDFVPALSQLAAIYESQKQFGKALPYREKAAGLWPKNAMLKAQLANTMVSLGKTQEAITLYQKAIALDGQIPLWLYNGLGNALAKNGQLEEAIASYEKALELQPDNPNLPNLPQQIAGLKKALEERENQGEIYNKIWKALNQTSLENLDQESANFPTEINPDHVSQYFNVTNQVKIINLASLSEEDKLFIESAGLSLEYLNLNKRLVTKEGVSEEKASQREQNIELQHLAAKDGYIYAVCPSTGKIVQSNRSLFFHARLFFYRFVASEVFYLIFAGVFQKDSLYFPRLELIVHLVPQEMLLLRTKAKAKKQVELCKTEVVQNWTRFKSYFLSMREAKKVVLVGYFFSIWHHLHNELSGLYKAQQAGCLHQIDQFLVVAPEYYGGIDEIFEIDSEKIKRLNAESESKKAEWIIEEVKNEIFENNLFAFSLNEEVLKQYRKSSINVIKLIYQHSLKKCSPAVLAEVEEAKQKYFPLLWINVRLNQRVWLDQEEGIANIVKSLCSHFPNLGVVFDGFTRQERKGSLVVNPHEEQIIKQEKKLVSKIQSLLPQEIKIYNNIGCFMYETIVWAKAIDLCLLSAGSNVTKTQAFNKPDVLHRSNAFAKVHGGTTDWDYIVDVNKGDGKTNYHCDWRVLYKQLFKLASSLKRD